MTVISSAPASHQEKRVIPDSCQLGIHASQGSESSMTVVSSPSMARCPHRPWLRSTKGGRYPRPSRGAWAYKYPSLDSQHQIVLTFRNKK
jgi:hypothetical protein